MRFPLALICAFFTTSASWAQTPVHFSWTNFETSKSFIGLNGGVNATSAQFSNKFISALLFEPYVDAASIGSQNKNLDVSNNRFGGDYEISLTGAWNIKNSAHSMLFKASDAGHAHVRAPQNLFGLAFSGNKRFAGDTAYVTETQGQGLRYQQLGLGWSYAPKSGQVYYAMFNYLNGEQYFDMDVSRASIYTSSFGDTVSIDAVGGYRQSDTGNIGFGKPNGSGASIDFGLQRTFSALSSDWIVDVAVYNLGAMYWNGRTLRYQIDTSIVWTGVEIEDPQNVNAQFSDGSLEDSLLAGFQEGFSRGIYRQIMPGWFHAELMQRKVVGLEFGGGMVVRWKADNNPYGYVIGGYQIAPKIGVHGTLGYGGYGKMQLGFKAAFKTNHFVANLALNNLEAWIAQEKYFGATARINLAYLF